MENEIHILSLQYDIEFHDSDEGRCYAGEGRRIISVQKNKACVNAIISAFNPILAQAEKENIVVPIQPFNRRLRKQFGFDLHDIDNGYNFKLIVETYTVDE